MKMRLGAQRAAILTAGPAQAPCLSYVVRMQLAGMIEEKTFPGPPDCENIASGDRSETCWLLEQVKFGR